MHAIRLLATVIAVSSCSVVFAEESKQDGPTQVQPAPQKKAAKSTSANQPYGSCCRPIPCCVQNRQFATCDCDTRLSCCYGAGPPCHCLRSKKFNLPGPDIYLCQTYDTEVDCPNEGYEELWIGYPTHPLSQDCEEDACERKDVNKLSSSEDSGVDFPHHGLRLVQSNPGPGQILAKDYILALMRAAEPLSVPEDVRFLKFAGRPLLVEDRDIAVMAVRVPAELQGSDRPKEIFLCVELEEVDATATVVTDFKIRPRIIDVDSDDVRAAAVRPGQCTVDFKLSTDPDADKYIGIIWFRQARR